MKDQNYQDEDYFLALYLNEKFTVNIGGIFFLSYDSGKTNQWNHICLSFDRETCHVAFVKVCNILKCFNKKE